MIKNNQDLMKMAGEFDTKMAALWKSNYKDRVNQLGKTSLKLKFVKNAIRLRTNWEKLVYI